MRYEVFIVNVSRKSTQVQFPIWAGVLVNSLRQKGIDPQIIDLTPVDTEEREEAFLRKIPNNPSIIGFNIMAGNDHINQVEKYAQLVRNKNPESIIVYGGALPSSLPELLMNNCVCDYIISGEGELSFPLFINSFNDTHFDPASIPGLFYRKHGQIFGSKHKKMQAFSNYGKFRSLTELSSPDYSPFDMDFYVGYLKETGQSFELLGSRGCKGNCSFCHRLVYGYAIKTPDLILDEIEEAISQYGIDCFYFVDENFIENKMVFKDFLLKKQQKGLDFTFRGQCRVDAIDEEICTIGKDDGFKVASMGIESANQDTLKKMGKGIKVSQVEATLALLRKHEIGISVNFIIGFPWDTEDDYVQMIEFIKRNGLERQGKVSFLTPSPGSKLWYDCCANGKITDEWDFVKRLGNLFFERMINLTQMPDTVLDYYYSEISHLIQRPVKPPTSDKYFNKLSELY